jgi:hypothetical protein
MRFDLKVPFPEKDEAKKLGARWDAARKIWFIEGKDNGPFAKWSPKPHDGAAAPAIQPKASSTAKPAQSDGKVYVGSQYVKPSVVCDCPPWEVCDKCREFSSA